jgi:hypothetical protein
LDKLDIVTAPSVMVPPVKDVAFLEKLHEQQQEQLTKLQKKVSQQWKMPTKMTYYPPLK